MRINEVTTDILVSNMMTQVGLNPQPRGSMIPEVHNALRNASKRKTGKIGYPDFTAQSNNFILIVENKADQRYQANYMPEKQDTLLMDEKSVEKYAENGALHYARFIVDETEFPCAFAFGVSGTEEGRMKIRPIFVTKYSYKVMPMEKDFSSFTQDRIETYYHEKVLEGESEAKLELKQILNSAFQLHEDLRNYGQLDENSKPQLVSAILLALNNPNFRIDHLTCGIGSTAAERLNDGEKLYNAIDDYLSEKYRNTKLDNLRRKKEILLDHFRFIRNNANLYNRNISLGKSPLRYFAEYIMSKVITSISVNNPSDVLGRFYGEFLSYSGGDGKGLGIVLTPPHITTLMVDLLDVTYQDKVFDPCCGTAGFLIAAMNKMRESIPKNSPNKEKILDKVKSEKLHGVEMDPRMFAIATTNMILRGDGKSNLECENFLSEQQTPLQKLRRGNFTVGLMNPPYSQAKSKKFQDLSELSFISRLLDALAPGGRCAVIVPQSTMVGKSQNDQGLKDRILSEHTLEGVITLNPQTFENVGVNPVIAIFTAHIPHHYNKYCKFIDFRDDGYKIAPHLGLVKDDTADKKREHLLDCWLNESPEHTSFMVKSRIDFRDEWLHSYFYFNDEIPSEDEFKSAMADYLSFQFSQIVHGRGYLFNENEEEKALLHTYRLNDDGNMEHDFFNRKTSSWMPFRMYDLFYILPGRRLTKHDMIKGDLPFIGATDSNNGVTNWVGNINDSIDKNVIGVNYNGSVCEAFYHPYDCIFSDDVKRLHLRSGDKSKYVALFLKTCIVSQKKVFGYGYKFNGERMSRHCIVLPVTDKGIPDWDFMDKYMRLVENKLLGEYINKILNNDNQR